jgi:hypothetical protein
MRYVLPRVVATMARSQELLLLFAIAWGVALAALGEAIGFSKEAGAFIAGFSLASTEYREAMNVRLTGIRDFLLLFFFIELGAKLELATLGAELPAAAILSVFVLVGNPLIVLAIMGAMGYRRRTGFLAGLTVAQISEFSIVFVAMGISLGHIGVGALGLTTLIGLVTITLSTYMILYSQRLYAWLAPWLTPFERRVPFRELAVEAEGAQDESADVLVVGVGRFGGRLLRQLQGSGVSSLGIDFDPEAVRTQRHSGHPVRFGDAEDADFLETLALERVRWVALTLPQWDENRAVVEALARTDFAGRIAVVARGPLPADDPLVPRIDHVLNPFDEAADGAAHYLREHLVGGALPTTAVAPPSPAR